MSIADRKPLIAAIEQKRQSRVVCCVTSDRVNAQGVIAKDFLPRFYTHLRAFESEKVDIFLFTLGGDTLAAYALSRFVREFTKQVGVLVPLWCHSAGTLFALGASEIFMSRMATLSSIDPSIVAPLNPVVEPAPGQRQPVPVAVESVTGYRNAIRDDWRLDDEGSAVAFRLLGERVNPLLIGDLYRGREQIVRLASSLLKLHRTDEDKIQKIVTTLASGLGSHDYLIGPTEARELLDSQVLPQDNDLEDLVLRLYEDFAGEMELGKVFNPTVELQAAIATNQQLPLRKVLKLVTIESEARADSWEREILMALPPAQPQVIRDGWR